MRDVERRTGISQREQTPIEEHVELGDLYNI